MAIFNEDPFDGQAKKSQGQALVGQAQTSHDIGQNLDALSLHELDERIALLQTEIERLTLKKQAKIASKSAADSFFK